MSIDWERLLSAACCHDHKPSKMRACRIFAEMACAEGPVWSVHEWEGTVSYVVSPTAVAIVDTSQYGLPVVYVETAPGKERCVSVCCARCKLELSELLMLEAEQAAFDFAQAEAAKLQRTTRTLSPSRFPVITICGSMRFHAEMDVAAQELSREGYIVLMPFVAFNAEQQLFDPVKRMLDDMHRAKIDLSSEIYVVNPGGYIGESTRGEIAHAWNTLKYIRSITPIDYESDTALRSLITRN